MLNAVPPASESAAAAGCVVYMSLLSRALLPLFEKITAFAAKAASILLGLLAIPVIFYSLGGMFGKTPDWVNIAIFFLADALLYLMSFRLLTRGALRGGARQLAGFLLLWALAFAFVFFTYRPIRLPLWQDPTNWLYGLAAARAAG